MNRWHMLTVMRTRLGGWILGGLPEPAKESQPRPEPPAAQASPEPASPEPARFPAPRFNGYPYLITPLSPGVFNLMLLPSEWTDDMLLELTRAQADANNLRACLALGPDRAVYAGDGRPMRASPVVPRSHLVETDALLPAIDFDRSADFAAREERLAHFVSTLQARVGPGFGDEVRGSVPASPDDVHALAGQNDDGSPRGLAPCLRCGEHRGICLDQVDHEEPRKLRVHCRCENINCCARCGDVLFERRLDANYYSSAFGLILYVPGGYARRHACAAHALRKAG
jgi:hypothetical protein